MYGNLVVRPEDIANWGKKVQEEDPVKLAEFEARIDRGEKIEPHDWMPFEYRRQLIRLIEQHAHSEIIGALPEGTWITRAPNFRRKLALMAKVQDEVGHAQLLYSAAETLGKTRETMINDLLSGKSKYSNIFNYPAKTWADTAVIAWLVDAGAIINQTTNAKGSYGPYVRALERICWEESFHLKYGYDNVVYLATGTPQQRAMLRMRSIAGGAPLCTSSGRQIPSPSTPKSSSAGKSNSPPTTKCASSFWTCMCRKSGSWA